ncbi:MAG TPA: PrsW family glutamic-type intramembrane protease [Caldilineaceae bacterium]|nr:PrsW family glutamic-type intramembrane protease [Caldilineaceae bacterium]
MFNRMLYDSPLHTLSGKLIYAAILLITFYFSAKVWIGWLTPLSNGWLILYAMTIAFCGSLIGIAFLLYLDRRDPEPWWFFAGTLLAALLLTTAPAAYFNSISPAPTLTVGFNEEFWKVLPLLLLIFFAPTLVSGTRDGLIYGALGGFGFNIAEIANYFLKVSYPAEGLDGLTGQLARLGWWGIGNHVFWSALVGAGIGYAVETDHRVRKFTVPLGAYLAAVLTHTLQDNLVGPLLGVGLMALVLLIQGVDFRNIDLQDTQNLPDAIQPAMGIALPLEALVINIINIPLLIIALRRSGNWERELVREELADESAEIVTPEEYEGVRAEERFRLRRVPGYPRRVGRQIRNAQNALAFHKRYLRRRGRSLETDPLVTYWRDEVLRLRNAQSAPS